MKQGEEMEKKAIGDSLEYAIKFTEIKTESDGVAAEYEFLAERYGIPKLEWYFQKQTCISHQGKRYDIIKIKLLDESILDIYFDITDWFGKHD